MHKLTLAIGIFVTLTAIGANNAARSETAVDTSDKNVADHCKGRMHYGGGQAGCTVVENGNVVDYNCSNGTHGVKKGCTMVIAKVRPKIDAVTGSRTHNDGTKTTGGSGGGVVGAP